MISLRPDAPPGVVEARGQVLARQHALSDAQPLPVPSWSKLDRMTAWLDSARTDLLECDGPASKAAEWILDNEYVIKRAILQVAEDLPPGFYARLPALADRDGAGQPRIFAVGREFLRSSRLQLSRSTLTTFVSAYQRAAPLTIAELWALPTVLRLACLEVLVESVGRLLPSVSAPFEVDGASVPLEDTECVARAIGNLRAVGSIPWQDFFRECSRAEAILREDPAGAYARMDFETADRYRRIVEELARGTTHSELDVAERVVTYAQRAAGADHRRAHVGYWLIDAGRTEFEASLGYRPRMGERLRRWVLRHATGLYLTSLAAATVTAVALPAAYLAALHSAPWQWLLALAVVTLPATAIGVTFVHWAVTRLFAPHMLPKLDFSRAIPPDCKTAIAIPALAHSPSEAKELVERLEGHFLANPDPVADFVLLTDFADADRAELPEDAAILEVLVEGIRRLNRAHPAGGGAPFHVLHRPRLHNPAEGCWMAWERKRGKLEEFNAFLLGHDDGAFSVHEGDAERLAGVRFVVTLDADTALPRGTLARLVGVLAHPVNQAEFDDQTGRVIAGYTVVQPRVELSPETGNRSRFTRWFSGDTAIDIYSRAVSDVYQDLFDSGIFVGKGIYDVGAFRRSVEGRVPENALASHDLFEGIHGRAALATDIVLYESFPLRYLEFTRRMHRWIRGDWQLVPWLRRRVPGRGGARLPNRLTLIDRWKIVDNLRRSLLAPSLVVMLVLGWLLLPGSPWVWTTLALLAPGGHLFTDLVTGLSRGARRSAMQSAFRPFLDQAGRWFLLIAFLPYEAYVALDAIVRTAFRLGVTRRHLLEWTTAARTAAQVEDRHARLFAWRSLAVAPALSLVLGTALALVQPVALWSALPLLVLWFLAPEIMYRVQRTAPSERTPLDARDRSLLRQLARRTWLFFETFAGPEDQWLPPDNFQEDPGGVIAHRTSPTNIGMLLLSTVAAWDLGYVGLRELTLRLSSCLDTLKRLERYRGHFLNWYDTRTLAPLEPRYVSTVDSGNLAASLIALKEAALELSEGPALAPQRWDGLVDVLELLGSVFGKLDNEPVARALAGQLEGMAANAARARSDPSIWAEALDALTTRQGPEFDRTLREAVDDAEVGIELDALHEMRIWLDRVHHHLHTMQRELDDAAPWLPLLCDAPPSLQAVASKLADLLPIDAPLGAVEHGCDEACTLLDGLEPDQETSAWIASARKAVADGRRRASELRAELLALAGRAEAVALAMDFRLLYDRETHLFHIGYNVSADRIDSHHYDLLASEARIASFVAIAKGDVPLEHWFRLGRPVTEAGGALCLVSWGGSMFEYLMPPLLMRSGPGTFLAQSEAAAVAAQRELARELRIPWGISESGFASLDADRNYRYRAFGVPTLGLRRGLLQDVVVAPYASVLALERDPESVLANLRELVDLGAVGEYGLYEALDFTEERAPEGRRFSSVFSYMAHHQGMVLAALDNALCGDALVRRFSADRRVQSVGLLLHERIPLELPPHELPPEQRGTPGTPVHGLAPLVPWRPKTAGAFPELLTLGNGRLSSWITDSGSGGLRWQDLALTRWSLDPTTDAEGLWIYVHDEEREERWSATRQPAGVPGEDAYTVFHPHMAEFHRRDQDIALRLEVVVAPADDVEIRRITLVNESGRPRTLSLTSYGEVVLAPARDDARHPAFSKLFVHSEHYEALDALLFTRRPRDPSERPPVLLHRLIADDPGVECVGFEGDRRAFLGRGRDARRPDATLRSAPESTGWTLDPAFALRASVELEPNQVRRLAFVTVVAGSRESAIETAERYQTLGALDWVIADASTEAARDVHGGGLEPSALPDLHTLASMLHFPNRALRAATSTLAANELGQPRLWAMGLSGDLPILLVRTEAEEPEALVQMLVRAHAFWRKRGHRVDLVVLRQAASGYFESAGERVQEWLRHAGALDQLGRDGGVHFVAADQIAAADRRLLEATARVVLDAGAGSLSDQLRGVHAGPLESPPFSRSDWGPAGDALPPVARPEALQFDNGLGGFSEDGREYVLHLAPGMHTPAPWSNVIANEQFGCLVTEAGGGFTWAVNSGENRLTPWTNDPVADPGGEALFCRDEETGAVWTPTPGPAGVTRAVHQVAHGAGFTEWRSNSHGLEQRLRISVPPEDPVKVIRMQLRNHWERPRRITLTYYAEWVLGVVRSTTAPSIVPEYDAEYRALLARNPWNPEFAERVAFLTSTHDPHGVTGDRTEFIGREGTLAAPAALGRWGLSGRVLPGADPCAAFQVHVDLEPGAETVVSFLLGQGDDRRHAHELIERWRDPERVERVAEEVAAFWEPRLGAVRVCTPDPAMDLMLNRWLPYQTYAARLFARAGFHQAGGAIGFRDQLQDALSLVHAEPERLRRQLLACAAHQFEEGDVLHWWHPPAGRGVRTRCSDDLLWLPFATAHYVAATGDESILSEPVPFLHDRPLASDETDRYAAFSANSETRSLFEHCRRALDKGVTHGPHGLPRIEGGDWNDGMNRVGAAGRGESVWLGWFAISAMQGFADLCHRHGERDLEAHWRRRVRELSRRTEESGWDGEWYRRAFDDEGRAWGSATSEECRIDSIAQSWAALSGAGRADHVRAALRAAERELVREDEGIVRLLWPPFDVTPRDPGYIKAYPPGVRENGGQYTHAAAWLGLAFAAVGEGASAARLFRVINPIAHTGDPGAIERYRAEPYVIAADVGAVPPHVGRGGWTWYTGSSAWTWRLGVEGILGLRRAEGGLRIDPCLPKSWLRAEARVRTEGGTLAITIEDPTGAGRGVTEIRLDGEPVKDIVPLPDDGNEHRVVVRVGKS